MGDSTLPMALAVGQTGTVIAFEANAYVFATLAKNASLNPDLGRIYAYNLAVTEESRMYEFSYNDPGFMNGGAVEKTRGVRRGDAFRQMVKGVRLTDFLNQNFPSLCRAFATSRSILKDAISTSCNPFLTYSEKCIDHSNRSHASTTAEYRFAMYDFLVGHGYHVHHHENSKTSSEPIQRGEMLESDNFDLFCIHQSEVSANRHRLVA